MRSALVLRRVLRNLRCVELCTGVRVALYPPIRSRPRLRRAGCPFSSAPFSAPVAESARTEHMTIRIIALVKAGSPLRQNRLVRLVCVFCRSGDPAILLATHLTGGVHAVSKIFQLICYKLSCFVLAPLGVIVVCKLLGNLSAD